jgi:DNA-binding NtrC family response regulator
MAAERRPTLRRILVVDARPTGLRVMEGVLGSAGQAIFTATPAEALATIRLVPIDALVACCDLDGESGLDLLREAAALRAGVGRVVVGPVARMGEMLSALEQGLAGGYVLEPAGPDDLMVALGRVLRSQPPRLVVVAEDLAFRERVSILLAAAGIDGEHAGEHHQALAKVEMARPDAVLVELASDPARTLALLGQLRAAAPAVRVVVRGTADLPQLVADLRRMGVYDYVSRDAADDQVVFRLLCALEDKAWADQLDRAPSRAEGGEPPELIVGSGRVTQAMRALVGTVAQSTATILVRGETGSGKDLVARQVHALSRRRAGPFFAINCAALTETLFESEMFGHEKGAFTGATAQKPGLCELASEGTLFLDEVGDLTLPAQAKLLRFLQSGEFIRLGGRAVLRSDARIIAATNRPLEQMIDRGEFRADLFHRLNILHVEVPPLRHRFEDMPELVIHLMAQLSQKHGRPRVRLSPRAFERLLSHQWPGNVRELESVLERGLLMAQGEIIEQVTLPRGGEAGSGAGGGGTPPVGVAANLDQTLSEVVDSTQRQVERDYLIRLLTLCGGHVMQAAKRAGMDRRNFYRKLAEHGIDPETFRRTGLFPPVLRG